MFWGDYVFCASQQTTSISANSRTSRLRTLGSEGAVCRTSDQKNTAQAGLPSERGQMAVEVAVVTPVILLVLVIAIDMLVFTGECARFDHVVPQLVLANTTAAGSEEFSGDATASIQSALDVEFAHNGSYVTISCADAGQVLASMVVYTCEFHFAPWPLSISGAPALLNHSCSIAVDSYVPGALL